LTGGWHHVRERRFLSERPIGTGTLARPLVALLLVLAIIPPSFAGGSAGGPRFVPNGGVGSMAGAGNTLYLTGEFHSTHEAAAHTLRLVRWVSHSTQGLVSFARNLKNVGLL
jgi:hypothetical protein